MKRVCLNLVFTIFISNLVFGQAPGTGSTSIPLPGAGHDYIKAISETVDPSSGSASIRIALPIPKGRGLALPLSFAYDSNGVFVPIAGSSGFGAWGHFKVGNYMSTGGWSYTLPVAASESTSYTPGGSPTACYYTTNYRLVDASGARRGLGLFAMLNQSPTYCASFTSFNVFVAGDIAFRAALPSNNGAISALKVADADGTVYTFATSGTANLIEDRNGNQIKIQETGTTGVFTETDTLGRSVLSSSGFGTTGNTVTVAGQGAPFTLTWGSPSYNFSIGATLVFNGNTSACQFVTSASGNLSVVRSIQLPNLQSYSFKYGTDDPNNSNPYGLISQVTYPSGGWIKYSWAGNPSSAGGVFPNVQGQAGQCSWRWGKPALLTRTISFDGVNPALKQTFQYSTTWPNGTATAWSSKQTTVTTQDLIRGTSFVTTYLYSSAVSSGEPAPKYIGINPGVDMNVPVEQTITYKDTGGTTLETVTKSWFNAEQLQTEQDTFGTATSKKAYTFGSGGQLTEKDEFDFGQSTATRKTINTYQSFASTPIYTSAPYIFDKPCKTVVSDGNNNPAAETDYLYDNGTAVCGASGSAGTSGVTVVTGTHDENNYAPTSSTARANLTKKIQKCFVGATACTDSTTTYSYDETGQVSSMIDPCGNASCPDMTGAGHTTSYLYTDSPSGGNPAGNSNAYLTKITDAVGHIQTFSYDYTSGQLTVSKDPNGQSSGLMTTYQYNDPFARLTEVDYPDGGQTKTAYSDAPPSPSVTTCSRINGAAGATCSQTTPATGWKTTVASMDGIGHVVQTKLVSDPDGTDSTDTTYDGMGRVLTQSNPHRMASSPTDGTITYLYDALGRTTKVTQPDGSIALTSYSGRATDAMDEGNGNGATTIERVSQVDGLGRLAYLCEVTSSTLLGAGGDLAPEKCAT